MIKLNTCSMWIRSIKKSYPYYELTYCPMQAKQWLKKDYAKRHLKSLQKHTSTPLVIEKYRVYFDLQD